jgi:hypothetical protein
MLKELKLLCQKAHFVENRNLHEKFRRMQKIGCVCKKNFVVKTNKYYIFFSFVNVGNYARCSLFCVLQVRRIHKVLIYIGLHHFSSLHSRSPGHLWTK